MISANSWPLRHRSTPFVPYKAAAFQTLVEGGTLAVDSAAALGMGRAHLNGGMLLFRSDAEVTRLVTLGAADGTIDTAGNAVRLSHLIVDDVGVAGGSLRVTNSTTGGSLELLAENAYTGGTHVLDNASLIAGNTAGSATGTGQVLIASTNALKTFRITKKILPTCAARSWPSAPSPSPLLAGTTC